MEPLPFYAALLVTFGPLVVWLWIVGERQRVSLKSLFLLLATESVALVVCAPYWRWLFGL